MGHRSSAALVLCVSFVLWSCDSSWAAIFYRNHTLKQWCDPNPVVKAVRKLINQQNDLFLTRENPLQITHRWDSTFNDDCVFTVEAEHGSGLVMNVNQMYFRPEHRDPLNECMDYLRLVFRNGTKTHKMCGLVNATTVTSNTVTQRSFIVPDGKAEIKIRLDDFRKLRGREHLYVDLLFTQYDDCLQPNSFQCSDQMCIHQKYFNDGNINCPYPKCSDESSCYNKTIGIPQVGSSKRAIIGGIAAAVVLAVLVPITICCCCEFCRKGAVSRGQRNRGGPTSSNSSSGAAGENRSSSSGGGGSGGGRRHRHRTNRSGSRGNRHADQDPGATRPQNVGFTSIVGGEQARPLDDQKESPPPTYDSLFPER